MLGASGEVVVGWGWNHLEDILIHVWHLGCDEMTGEASMVGIPPSLCRCSMFPSVWKQSGELCIPGVAQRSIAHVPRESKPLDLSASPLMTDLEAVQCHQRAGAVKLHVWMGGMWKNLQEV